MRYNNRSISDISVYSLGSVMNTLNLKPAVQVSLEFPSEEYTNERAKRILVTIRLYLYCNCLNKHAGASASLISELTSIVEGLSNIIHW